MYPHDYFNTYWRPDLLDEVFIAMPFSTEFEQIWEAVIRPAIEEDQAQGLSAHRVDTTILAGSVITELLEGISRSRIVLADISITSQGDWVGQRNGNVMYEVGIAHAMRQATEVILIRSDQEKINFDLAGVKIYGYDATKLTVARKQVASLIGDHLKQIEQFKSLNVERVIRLLDSECLRLFMKHSTYLLFYDTKPEYPAQQATLLPEKIAAAKLLELGVTYCDYDSSSRYAYHWTPFGRAVLQKMKFSIPST